jgi:hypothetical protein
MEEIEKRLRESTDACIKSFENWVKQNKNLESRESLMEAMHEVRKVIARVEIEIAISERDRLGSRPLPIPPHRSSRKSQGSEEGDFGDDDGNFEAPEAPRQNEGRRQHGGGRERGGRRPMHGGGRGNQGGNNSPGSESGGNGNSEGQAS